MVMIFLQNSNIEKVKDKLSQCFLTNLELGIWDLKDYKSRGHRAMRSVWGTDRIKATRLLLAVINKSLELPISHRARKSHVTALNMDSTPISLLCHMGDFGCGDGGWTPVMKTDGNKVFKVIFLSGNNNTEHKSTAVHDKRNAQNA